MRTKGASLCKCEENCAVVPWISSHFALVMMLERERRQLKSNKLFCGCFRKSCFFEELLKILLHHLKNDKNKERRKERRK